MDEEYSKWLKDERNASKYFGFYWSLKFLTRGTLYAFEAASALGLTTLIIIIAGDISLVTFNLLFLFSITLAIGLLDYIVYLIYETQLDRRYKRLIEDFHQSIKNAGEKHQQKTSNQQEK